MVNALPEQRKADAVAALEVAAVSLAHVRDAVGGWTTRVRRAVLDARAAGVSIRRTAQVAGVSPSTVTEWEKRGEDGLEALRWTSRCRDCGSLMTANPRYPAEPDHAECMDCGSTDLDRVPVPDDEGLALITEVEEAADRADAAVLRRALLTEVYADPPLAARVLRNLTQLTEATR